MGPVTTTRLCPHIQTRRSGATQAGHPPGSAQPPAAAGDGHLWDCARAGQSPRAPGDSPGLVLQPVGQETAQAAGKLCEEAAELLRRHMGDDAPEGHLGNSHLRRDGKRGRERGVGLQRPEPPVLLGLSADGSSGRAGESCRPSLRRLNLLLGRRRSRKPDPGSASWAILGRQAAHSCLSSPHLWGIPAPPAVGDAQGHAEGTGERCWSRCRRDGRAAGSRKSAKPQSLARLLCWGALSEAAWLLPKTSPAAPWGRCLPQGMPQPPPQQRWAPELTESKRRTGMRHKTRNCTGEAWAGVSWPSPDRGFPATPRAGRHNPDSPFPPRRPHSSACSLPAPSCPHRPAHTVPLPDSSFPSRPLPATLAPSSPCREPAPLRTARGAQRTRGGHCAARP